MWAFSLVVVQGLLMAVVFLVAEHRFYGSWAQLLWLRSSRAQAQQLWHMGFVAARHFREQTGVSYIGRQILYHLATKEVLLFIKY